MWPSESMILSNLKGHFSCWKLSKPHTSRIIARIGYNRISLDTNREVYTRPTIFYYHAKQQRVRPVPLYNFNKFANKMYARNKAKLTRWWHYRPRWKKHFFFTFFVLVTFFYVFNVFYFPYILKKNVENLIFYAS